jgi:hypothetical protein
MGYWCAGTGSSGARASRAPRDPARGGPHPRRAIARLERRRGRREPRRPPADQDSAGPGATGPGSAPCSRSASPGARARGRARGLPVVVVSPGDARPARGRQAGRLAALAARRAPRAQAGARSRTFAMSPGAPRGARARAHGRRYLLRRPQPLLAAWGALAARAGAAAARDAQRARTPARARDHLLDPSGSRPRFAPELYRTWAGTCADSGKAQREHRLRLPAAGGLARRARGDRLQKK